MRKSKFWDIFTELWTYTYIFEGHSYNNNDDSTGNGTCKDNKLSRVHHVAKRDMARYIKGHP